MTDDEKQLLQMTTAIVAAYVGRSETPVTAIPDLMKSVHGQLRLLAGGEAAEKPKPAVQVKNSVHADHLICLDCGEHMKMLKRHILAAHDMTPDQYREKWGLPGDYSMVAPNYSEVRSGLAKQTGLGTRPTTRRARAA